MGPFRNPKAGQRRPAPNERFVDPRVNNPFLSTDDEDATQPRLVVPAPQAKEPHSKPIQQDLPQETAYREHVSGMLNVPPSEAPKFYPAYNPYQASPQQYPKQQGGPGAI